MFDDQLLETAFNMLRWLFFIALGFVIFRGFGSASTSQDAGEKFSWTRVAFGPLFILTLLAIDRIPSSALRVALLIALFVSLYWAWRRIVHSSSSS